MDNTVRTTISTTYKHVDGWHVFASDELAGLYVASKDLATAFRDVAPSIQALLKLDEGIDCMVAPEVPFDEWLAAVRGVASDFDDHVPTRRRFVVYSGIGCA